MGFHGWHTKIYAGHSKSTLITQITNTTLKEQHLAS